LQRLLRYHARKPPQGSDEARDFVGSNHGAELTLILINAPNGHGPALHRHPYEEIFVVYGGTGTFSSTVRGFRLGPATSSWRQPEQRIGSSTLAAIGCG
jgi:mannose-6-phosphate isomerase-like protein (cupin superfamily)